MTTRAHTALRAGDVLELAVGEVVHGGWCVSRHNATGWVIFVRHALPGERVQARITQVTSRFARADAIEIMTPSADRVAAPCRYAGPGGCGGCDWQHASLPAQRALKATVVRQQLSRLAGLDTEVTVEAVPGDTAGLGWRTSVSFAVAGDGTAGLRRHRSREVIGITECLIAHPLVTAAEVTSRPWPGMQQVQVSVVPATGERGIALSGGTPSPEVLAELRADTVTLAGRPSGPGSSAGERRAARRSVPLRGTGQLAQRAAGHAWRLSLGGFWQVHPGAADTLTAAVLKILEPQLGDVALDLYCGAGLFAGVLAGAVGRSGAVLAVDEDRAAVRDARHNLRDWPWARAVAGDVATVLGGTRPGQLVASASLAVLDPPRTGLARGVTEFLCAAARRKTLRRIAYVSCDPATLARDLRLLLDAGWQLDGLRGFDAFPMTHHVECVAALSHGPQPG